MKKSEKNCATCEHTVGDDCTHPDYNEAYPDWCPKPFTLYLSSIENDLLRRLAIVGCYPLLTLLGLFFILIGVIRAVVSAQMTLFTSAKKVWTSKAIS